MNQWYDISKTKIGSGDLDLDSLTAPTIAALTTGDYVFSQAHEFFDDVAGVAVLDSVALANETFGTLAESVFDCDDVTFVTPTAGEEVFAFVIYDDTGSAATSPLLFFIDQSSNLPITTVAGRDLEISFNASGVAKL